MGTNPLLGALNRDLPGQHGPAATSASVEHMSAKDKGVASVRQMFGAALLQEATQEEINQLVADVLGTKKARKIQCPECQVEFRVEWPDVKGQVDTVIALTEQTEGKASSEQLEATTVVIERIARR